MQVHRLFLSRVWPARRTPLTRADVSASSFFLSIHCTSRKKAGKFKLFLTNHVVFRRFCATIWCAHRFAGVTTSAHARLARRGTAVAQHVQQDGTTQTLL